MSDISAIATLLLRCGAVKVDAEHPFTWTSGIRAPIYCDNRVLYSHPAARRAVVDALVAAIRTLPEPPEALAGTATAAIGWGAMVAERLDLPFAYVRPARKEHGNRCRVEGDLRSGMRVCVIEDLLSTGGSAVATVAALREEAEARVTDVIAIVSYTLPLCARNARRSMVELHPLVTVASLLAAAEMQGMLRNGERAAVEAFLHDPEGWRNVQESVSLGVHGGR